MLLTATGHGRSMDVVVHLIGREHEGEVEAFFKNLDLVPPGGAAPTASSSAPEAPPGSPGGPAEANGMSFSPPKGWSRTTRADAVVYVSPPYPNTGERCELAILPMRRGSGGLHPDAAGTFQSLFRVDPMGGYPGIPPTLVRGTSPLGWSYVTLQKTLGQGGSEGPGIMLFLAGVGDQVATVITTSKYPLV